MATPDFYTDKRTIAWRAWFVTPKWTLARYASDTHQPADMPADGFLCGVSIFADGCKSTCVPAVRGADGAWVVYLETPHGTIFQSTDGEIPTAERYPGGLFIRGKLAPEPVWHEALYELEGACR